VLNRSAEVPKLAKWNLSLSFLNSAAVAILLSIKLRCDLSYTQYSKPSCIATVGVASGSDGKPEEFRFDLLARTAHVSVANDGRNAAVIGRRLRFWRLGAWAYVGLLGAGLRNVLGKFFR
jgi:hypothetical protein